MQGNGYNIAIVEDEPAAAQLLMSYFDTYAKERHCICHLKHFPDAVSFLSTHRKTFDLVLMDVEMPGINGMEAAHRLRELDSHVALIFVTNLAQYAIEGYEVKAVDYLLKPVKYHTFAFRIDRVLKLIKESFSDKRIVISTDRGTVVLAPQDVMYIETMNHQLIYHTRDRSYSVFGTLKDMQERLESDGFARSNSCYLVNLRYVKNAKRYELEIGGETLPISRAKYKEFMESLNDYLGNGF